MEVNLRDHRKLRVEVSRQRERSGRRTIGIGLCHEGQYGPNHCGSAFFLETALSGIFSVERRDCTADTGFALNAAALCCTWFCGDFCSVLSTESVKDDQPECLPFFSPRE